MTTRGQYTSIAPIQKGDTITWLGERMKITKTKTSNNADTMIPAFWVGDTMFTWRSSLREYRAFGYPASTEPCTLD